MLDHKTIEQTIALLAKENGVNLDRKDMLELRTRVAMTLAAKERHRQRMNSPTYQWKKPEKCRRG
ncbi:hypothetical protein BSQ98_18285 [Serratia liquefaciens]|uniref:hypothetical protein n=1 Tax=Serratia liquefaciens TaxID=614 RepID=UPI00101F8791|nr:hypothetical protein [Serratia liquefaciens]RYM61156.1 hypothetical protein BSQ98_18285 [Serratia liquefaciens]